MKRDLISTRPLSSSFLSVEKDFDIILRKLFLENKPYSDYLKRLLLINTRDCLDDKDNPSYIEKVKSTTLADLIEDGYIKITPKLSMPEHEQVKSYILMSLDSFTPNGNNPEFRDCVLTFHVLCHTDYWNLGNFRLRPFKIVGYIDGLLNKSRLTGIGKLEFMGCSELVLDDEISGYTIAYKCYHGSDDQIRYDD